VKKSAHNVSYFPAIGDGNRPPAGVPELVKVLA